MLEKAAARANGEPCVTYLGSGSAGHYVKMVHNGIEYGFMQLTAEAYDFMKSGLGLSASELRGVFEEWNRSELESYLIEITARIFDRTDEKTGRPLIDRILDAARQKGTGKWMSQEAMELQVPTPTIDAAVMMRNLSSHKQAREKIGGVFSDPGPKLTGSRRERLGQLKDALYAGLILTFAQGMNLLRKASEQYGYGLDPAAVSRIWRGGCIIRAALLEDVRSAYEETPDLENLMLHPKMAEALKDRQTSLRQVTAAAVQIGVPFAAFASSTGYFDGYRRARLPANLIQAQRDYFGSHRYERLDGDGMFHTRWREQ
jgi:6-phosphogluconate dehydrogenase